MQLAHCNEKQAKALLCIAKVALLPLGSTEPHGDHLPLATDNLLAERFALEVEKRLSSEFELQACILPTLPFSQVWSLAGHAGALDIGQPLLTELLVKLAENMAVYGITTTAVINSHFGNFDAMKAAARILKPKGITLLSFTWFGTQSIVNDIRESAVAHNSFMHADEIETAMMLALAPEWVQMSKARAHYPQFPTSFSFEQIPWTAFSEYSVLGDPTYATPQKGKLIIEQALNETVHALGSYLKESVC